jgi:cobalt-precorrin 5A hydrolase
LKAVTISFTPKGDLLNKKIAKLCFENAEVYGNGEDMRHKDGTLREWTEQAFKSCELLVFVGAVGIAVRAIAPFVKSKACDPAVLAIDEAGRFVVPVLSGHIGGANRIASEVAKKIGATAVITTATDINGVFAVDVWATENGFAIENIENIKKISSALLKNENVGLVSDFSVKGELPQNVKCGENFECGIVISPFLKKTFRHTLNLVPKNAVWLGVGSKKNANEACLSDLFDTTVLSEKAICGVASIDLKKDEKAVMCLAKRFGCEPLFFSAEQLNCAKGDFESSEFVLGVTGVDNVCERSAVLAAKNGRIILKKTCGQGCTMAAAMSDRSVCFENYNGGCGLQNVWD